MNIGFRYIFIVFLITFQAWAQKANPLLKKADSLFIAGNYEAAKVEYQNITSTSTLLKTATFTGIKIKLADCYFRLGDYEMPVIQLSTLLGSIKTTENAGLLNYISAQTIISLCALNKGNADDALENLTNTLTLAQSMPKIERTTEMANLYSAIGLTNWNNGNNELAEEYHQKALSIRLEMDGKQSLSVASSYNDIGLLFATSNPDKALEYYNQALDIYKKIFPEKHPKIAYAYNNLAIVYRIKKDYTKAIEYLRKVDNIQADIYPAKHPNNAFLTLNYATLFKEQGSTNVAIDNFNLAIRQYTEIFGPKHPEIANVCNELSTLYVGKKKWNLALEYCQKALIANSIDFDNVNIYANPKSKSAVNPQILLSTLIQKANILETRYSVKTLKLRDIKTSLVTLEIADTIIDHLRQLKTNQKDKLQLGAIAENTYLSAIKVCQILQDVTLTPKIYREKAFYFGEENKSAVLASAIADTKAKHFANIPDSLITKEKKIKELITYYEQKILEPNTDSILLKQFKAKLFTANRNYESFVKQMETNFPAYYNLKYSNRQPTVNEIQALLKPDEALLSFTISDVDQKVYLYYISKSKFVIEEKFLKEDFEKNIKGFRNSIIYQTDEVFTNSSTYLYNQLWIASISKNIKRLIIVSDSKMGGIPVEAFIYSKSVNSYLINKYAFSYAFSVSLWKETITKKNVQQANSIMLCAPVKFLTMAQLPGTEVEVQSISNLFQSKNFVCSKYTFGNANTTLLKSNKLKNFRYLHLATHGVVNTSKPELSAVFLSPDSSKKDKGMLYAGELYNLNLNADLVTLSACETGLGKVSKGEGIIGLSRALMYAGAKNMIVSLWTVSDNSTSELMQNFYKNLLGGSTENKLSESLQKAKLDLIKNPNFSRPYYWAPFVMIGE
ncbi:MAG: CHAT domain-containing tetratricopeptide repeat protein [Bacteroidota bacterium]|nr:CHAT domain-containing tetratricopeptide repeat protein [Bacteroidota bacterium]